MGKKVLIIEDEPEIKELYRLLLSKLTIEIVEAQSLSEAKERVFGNPDIDLIILDGQLPDGRSFEGDFLSSLKKAYRGPIIGASSIYNGKLLAAGCSLVCNKADAHKLAKKVLGL